MNRRLAALMLTGIALTCAMPRLSSAEVEWNLTKQLSLEASPRDVAPSADGKWMYVLTAGEVLIYSLPEYKIVNRIAVDKSFDRVAFSAADNSLVLSSSSERSLKVLQLAVVHHFSIDGLPHKGPQNAPVTLAVFSDYQ